MDLFSFSFPCFQAVAHSAGEDGFYGDYFIPKGAVILGNAWSVFWLSLDKFV